MVPLFISGVEITFILLVVVILFGAEKIPEIAHGLGKAMKQVRNATNDIKSEIQQSAEKHGIDKDIIEAKNNLNKAKEDIVEATKPIKRTFNKP